MKKSIWNLKFLQQSTYIRASITLDEVHKEQQTCVLNNVFSTKIKNDQKDNPKDLTFSEYFKLETIVKNFTKFKEDCDKRIKQIVQSFHLSALDFKTQEKKEMEIVESVLSEVKQTVKDVDMKIAKNNEVIAYKNRLYLSSKIIIKLEPSSNFEKNRFDLNAFSDNGQLLCSFHNFSINNSKIKQTEAKSSKISNLGIERLMKSIENKFRKVESIYYVEKLKEKEIDLDTYLQLRQYCSKPNNRIKLVGVFYNKQCDLNEMNQAHCINGQLVCTEEFKRFCSQIQLNIVCNSTEVIPRQQNADQMRKIVQVVEKKKLFDSTLLKFISYDEQKIIQYRKRNQITLRLINYFYENYLKTTSHEQDLSIEKIQSFFTNLIPQILNLRKELQAKSLQRSGQKFRRHFPQILQKGPRLCLKCKQKKTKYQCEGCSLKYKTLVRLCLDCFEQFHSSSYLQQKGLPLLTKKSKAMKPLGSQRYFHQTATKQTAFIKKNQNLHSLINTSKQNQILDESDESSDDLQGPFDEFIRKFQQIQKFVGICRQNSSQQS